MKIMEKIAAWKDAAETNDDLYNKIQEESVAAVIGGIESEAWKTLMKRFHSNDKQLQRLLGNDASFDSEYKNTVLAYIGGGGVCGGGTRLSLPINMPDTYKAALDGDLLSETDNDSDPMPLPEDG